MKTTRLFSAIFLAMILVASSATFAQVKIGSNPTTITPNVNLEVEATNGDKTVITKDIGSVGIGTTAPTAKLDIDSGHVELTQGYAVRWGADNTGERIYSQTNLGLSGNNLYLESREYMYFVADRNNTTVNGPTMGFVWATNRSWQEGTPTEHMRLTDQGYLGIGINAPKEKLHANTTVANEGIALSQMSATNTVMLNSNTAGGYLGFINNSTNSDANLTATIQQREPTATAGGANDLFYSIPNDAGDHVFWNQVGIGTASPAAGFPLDVDGNILANNIWLTTHIGATNREIGVNPAGAIVVFASDGRLKKDVANLTTGLDKVMKLRPVYYNWKDTAEYGKQRELGFIAQEVKALIPEVTGTIKKDGQDYNTVNYSRLVPVLTKAIQEQQAEIETLKAANAKLAGTAAQVASLADQIKELKQMMGTGKDTEKTVSAK